VASVLSNIASMQEDQRDLAAAKKTYREVLDIRRALYPGANAKVARSLNNYGHILEITGDFAGAEKHYREAIAMADETLAKDHHERGYYLRNLASSLLAQGKAEEAEGYAQEALTILQHADPPIPWRIADAESLLGACLTDLGRYAEAEPLLTKGYAVLVKDKEDGAKRAPDALKRLINLYTAWGKPEKAAEYQAKLPAPAQTASAQR
jgi:serine/threonine-protein kinase